MAGKFELKRSSDGQYVFNLKAGNGQVILVSERYTERRGAVQGIESVRRNSAVDKHYERKTAKNGQSYFILRASNGRTIGQSEMYASAAALEKGIESVQKNAADATIDYEPA
jgi:hypothetical protein